MQQEQIVQAAPQVASSPYSSPLANFGSSIIMLTNPDQEIYKLELVLRGARLDVEGNVAKGTTTHELCNEKGVNSVLGQVQSIVNQVTVFGNLTKAEVNGLRDFLADTLAIDLMLNRSTYNITDASARTKIFFSAISYAVVTMSRGREGDEKKFLAKSVQEISTSVNTNGGAKQKGILQGLNPWNKN